MEDVKLLFTFIVVDLRSLETKNWDLKSIDGTTAVMTQVVALTTVAAYLPKIYEILVLWSYFDYFDFLNRNSDIFIVNTLIIFLFTFQHK